MKKATTRVTAIVLALGLSVAVTAGAQDVPDRDVVVSEPVAPYSNQAITNTVDSYAAIASEHAKSLEQIAPASSTKITQLHEDAIIANAELEEEIQASEQEVTRLGVFGHAMPAAGFDAEANPAETTIIEQRIEKSLSEKKEAADEATFAWEKEVVEQVARDKAAAEAKRKAEEAAAAAAANSSYGGYSDYTGSGEDLRTRINRVLGGLPFSFGYSIGSCNGALGCYTAGAGTMTMSPTLSGYSDCKIRRVLAHEYRHLLQDQQGLIQYMDGGHVSNRGWLESDAQAFEANYGC